MENLDIDETVASNIASSDITDTVFNAIKKYEDHPSIKKIKHFMSVKDLQFSFNFETKNKILAEIHNLDKKKACKESDIPVKIIKDNIDIFSEFILHNFNNSLFDATFPSELKKADVIPVVKKKDWNNVENYHPVSILANFLKNVSVIKCINTSILYSQNGNVGSIKVLAHSTVFLWWQENGENVWTKGV